MDRGLSARIIWPLALREAMVGQFEFIGPVHMLIALFKFSEAESSILDDRHRDSQSQALFRKERDALRELLEKHSIEMGEGTKRIRDVLRARIGQGTFEGRVGAVIHRSDEAKAVWRKAEIIAKRRAARLVTASHMFDALLQTRDEVIVNVLEAQGTISGVIELEEE